MTEFGGGGHPTAASATVKEATLEGVEDRLIEIVNESVKPGKIASDIMTRPVITIHGDVSIKEAESLMTVTG